MTRCPHDCDAVIVDESHGSGKEFDLSYARDVVQQIENTGHPCRGTHTGKCGRCHPQVHPYAVDVASGIEKLPGIKDHKKIAAFIAAARSSIT